MRWGARFIFAAAVAALALALPACGDDEKTGARTTLTWFIFNEPSGAPQKIADRCSRQSNGEYAIKFEYLPAQADQQREQLVRRLGAKDSSIDLIGMDVIWTGEFANAGWIRQLPPRTAQAASENVFQSMLDSASFEDKLYAVPVWSNTQLLWYRKDRVAKPPETWDQMIDQAEKIGPAKGRIQVQANRYEGLVVLVNQLIESAGTSVLAGPKAVRLDKAPTERALAILGRLSRSSAAATNLSTSTEDTARLSFEAGDSSFMINYPFVYPSAKENAPDVYKQMAAARYPKVDPGRDSAPPVGGINIGISSYSKNADVAFKATECLVRPENQIEVAKLGGLPPVREDVYDNPEIAKIYPGFADVIRSSIADGAARPSESPAYQDLSLAIQRAVHPTKKIDPRNPDPSYEELREKVEQAVKREGLL